LAAEVIKHLPLLIWSLLVVVAVEVLVVPLKALVVVALVVFARLLDLL
jgi:hypothetical protein